MNVLLLCWRDTHHPEGGGSELYLEHIAAYLAARGHHVDYVTAHYPGVPRREDVDLGERHGLGVEAMVRFHRGGGHLSVYPSALLTVARGLWGRGLWGRGMRRPDVIVDTQNGIPFFSSLLGRAAGVPVVMLTHHCHREQWSVAGPGLAQLGWLIESTISPRLHRAHRWVTVSQPSAAEFAALGVPAEQISIIRNGVDPVPADLHRTPGQKVEEAGAASARGPRLVALSRLVPHKQIEHALDTVAALRRTQPGLHLDIIGDGWWAGKLREHARELGVSEQVTFHGHVSERRKHELLAGADVHVMPSRKEGWGLAVIEAAQHGVPTVGYASSAGLRDSVVDGETGLLAGSPGGLINAVERLLTEPAERDAMGEAAWRRAQGFSWESTGAAWEDLLREVVRESGRRRG